jgi:hypothetical protein
MKLNMKSKKQFVPFDKRAMLNTRLGAGAASRYGSGSTKMMQLLAALAPQDCYKYVLRQLFFSNFPYFQHHY